MVGNDALFASTLYSFALAGAGAFDPVGGIGIGFGNVALTLAPGVVVTPVPEPSAALLSIAGLLTLALLAGGWPVGRRHRGGGVATTP